MRRKIYKHLILVNYMGITDKIKQFKKRKHHDKKRNA